MEKVKSADIIDINKVKSFPAKLSTKNKSKGIHEILRYLDSFNEF